MIPSEVLGRITEPQEPAFMAAARGKMYLTPGGPVR
jgi:hypothetical protein